MGKCGKRAFQSGGNISKADQLIAEMNAKYGVSGNVPPPAPVVQPPVQQPPPAPQQPQQRGLVGNAMQLFGNRGKQIDKAAGYRNGGIVRGFELGGIPDFKDDSQAGLEKRLAAMQAANGGASGSVTAQWNSQEQNDLMNKASGVSPTEDFAKKLGSSLMSAFSQQGAQPTTSTSGSLFPQPSNPLNKDPLQNFSNGGKIKGPGTPTSDSIPARVNETGEEIRVSNGERIVSAAQGALLEKMAKHMGFENLDQMLESGTGKPVGPTMKGGKRAAYNGGIFDKDPMAALSEAIGKNNAAVDAANAGVQKLYPEGTFDNTSRRTPVTAASAQPTTSGNPLVAGISNPSFGPAKDRFPVDAKSEFITGTNGAMPDSSGGGFVDGNTAYTVKPTSQDGISRVTAPGKNPLYTNISPESAVAGLNKQTIGQPADQEAQGLARIARAVAINKERIDAQPMGGIAVLPDQADEANAKLDAMRRSSMVSNLSPSQQAEFNLSLARMAQQDRGQQLASDNARYAADTQASRAAAHDNVIMRGQDLNAQNELARLQGNPLDNEAKRLSLSQAQQLSMLQGLVLNGKTPEEQATAAAKIRALSGKQDREDRAAKPMEIADPNDPMGQRKILVRPNDDGTYTPMQPRRSYAEFSQAYLAKRPGTSAEQIKADYEQLYGSR